MQKTDDELVKEFLAGDRSQARVLYLRYGCQVLRYALSLLGKMPDAEDLLQEVFVLAFERLNQYRGPGAFKRWLLTICRNMALKELRPKGVSVLAFDPEKENGSHAAPDQEAMLRRLDDEDGAIRSLAALPDRDREILLLRLGEQLSYGEIADLTGFREDHVRQIVSRSLTRLRKKVKLDDLHQV